VSTGIGRRGERLAGRWLRRRGYRMIARNLRRGRLEADLVAISPCGRCQVVVEVKAGVGDIWTLSGRIGPGKRRRLRAVAAMIHRATECPLPIRFDVVLVQLGPGRSVRIHHLPGAFEADG